MTVFNNLHRDIIRYDGFQHITQTNFFAVTVYQHFTLAIPNTVAVFNILHKQIRHRGGFQQITQTKLIVVTLFLPLHSLPTFYTIQV